jgi:hypothetical protein
MPVPIPTNYILLLDPLLGFTNGSTPWADQSVDENNFTFNNTSYTFESVIGSLLLPTGTKANEDVKPGTIPVGTSAYSIIGWVKVVETNPAADQFTLFSLGRTNSLGHLVELYTQNNEISAIPGLRVGVYNHNCGRLGNSNSNIIPYDTWTMISVTKPSSGNVSSQKLYINGVEVVAYSTSNGTTSVNTSVASGSNVRVSINNNLASTINSTTPGSVGEVWIYDQVLTGADMLNFYETTEPRYFPTPPVPDLSDGRSFGQGFNG